MPPSPLPGDLGGGEAAQFRMRTDGIVVLLPGGDVPELARFI
jgi:hypothetical protein